MQKYIVSGAGDGTYNGTYTSAGSHGGSPYYAKAAPVRYLYIVLAQWMLGDALPMMFADYFGTDGEALPANPWSVGGGVGPAPTVFRTHVFGIRPGLTQVEIR